MFDHTGKRTFRKLFVACTHEKTPPETHTSIAKNKDRKKGSDATVDMREMKKGDPVETFIIQVAALSWAATQVPEITVAIQSFLNTGFFSAVQVEFLFIIRCLHSVTKAAGFQS